MRILVVLALLAFARPAAADPLAKRVRVTYRLQVVIADGALLAITGIGAAVDSAPLAYAGLTGFLLATPILHAIHNKRKSSVGSVLMRFSIPLVGAVAGPNFVSTQCGGDPDPNCGEDEKTSARKIGIGVGMLFVTFIDVAFLARKWELRSLQILPVATRTPWGTTVGFAGSF